MRDRSAAARLFDERNRNGFLARRLARRLCTTANVVVAPAILSRAAPHRDVRYARGVEGAAVDGGTIRATGLESRPEI